MHLLLLRQNTVVILRYLGPYSLVKELVDRHVFGESLVPFSFYQQFTRQERWWAGFDSMQDNIAIQRVFRNYCPVIKHRVTMAWPCEKARSSVTNPKMSSTGKKP